MEYSNVLLGICIFVQVITKTGHSIQEAADLLNKGQLVAIPTETVYGLAANGLDQDAVSQIFKVKRRPLSNPLILHFKDLNSVSKYVSNIPTEAKKIAQEFWPGPLTLLLEKTAKIPNSVINFTKLFEASWVLRKIVCGLRNGTVNLYSLDAK